MVSHLYRLTDRQKAIDDVVVADAASDEGEFVRSSLSEEMGDRTLAPFSGKASAIEAREIERGSRAGPSNLFRDGSKVGPTFGCPVQPVNELDPGSSANPIPADSILLVDPEPERQLDPPRPRRREEESRRKGEDLKLKSLRLTSPLRGLTPSSSSSIAWRKPSSTGTSAPMLRKCEKTKGSCYGS